MNLNLSVRATSGLLFPHITPLPVSISALQLQLSNLFSVPAPEACPCHNNCRRSPNRGFVLWPFSRQMCIKNKKKETRKVN